MSLNTDGTNKIRIEAGVTYIARNGDIIGPLSKDPTSTWRWLSDNPDQKAVWSGNGKQSQSDYYNPPRQMKWDLIKKVPQQDLADAPAQNVRPEKSTFNLFDRFKVELATADRVVIETKNAVGVMDAYYLHAPSLLADLPKPADPLDHPKVKALQDALRPFASFVDKKTCQITMIWKDGGYTSTYTNVLKPHHFFEARAALAALEADT